MLPRTSPPTMASRATTSPSTTPPLATNTWRPARIVPTTVPSTFTTPSAVISPTTRIPVPMIDRPESASEPARPFSVNTAISGALFHERERIERSALAADFEVQMRRGRAAGVAGQRDHLPRRDLVTLADQEPRSVPIHALIPVGMPQEHEIPVVGIGPGRLHGSPAGRPHRGPERDRDIHPGVSLPCVPRPDLPAGDESRDVERPVAGA